MERNENNNNSLPNTISSVISSGCSKLWDNKGKLACGIAAVAMLTYGYKNRELLREILGLSGFMICVIFDRITTGGSIAKGLPR